MDSTQYDGAFCGHHHNIIVVNSFDQNIYEMAILCVKC